MLITPCLKKPLLYNSGVRVFSINGPLKAGKVEILTIFTTQNYE